MAVQRMGPPAAGEQAPDSGLAYEYDPDYIERKCGPCQPLQSCMRTTQSALQAA